MDNQSKRRAAITFAAAFAESLSEELATATGCSCPLEILDCPNTPTQEARPIHFRMTVEGACSGECFVEFYEPQVSDLVARILKQPAADQAVDPNETLAKVVASATEGLAASLSSQFGQLRCKVDPVAGLAFGGMFVVALASTKKESDTQVMLYFGVQLLDALSALQNSDSEADEPAVYPYNLKLVMDVELNVSLRFGQRQLPLRDVLELASGSVIELDRMVDEPVELFLDGKLIARGEAVVVDGNYGLRVTEIPQPVASHFLN